MRPVVLLTEFFPPAFGGIEDTLGHLAEARAGQLTVVTPASPGSEMFDRQQNYTIIRRSLFSGRLRPRWVWLVGFLLNCRRASPSTLVIFGHNSPAVTAGWLVAHVGLPYAVIVHGQDVLGVRSGWRGWFTKRNLRRAAWVGVNSTFMQRVVNQLGVPAGRIIIHHPALSEQDLQREPQAEHKPGRLITVCRLVARKNVAGVIESIHRLRSQFPNIEYHVLGDGPEHKALSELIDRRRLHQHVFLHGSVSESEKWKLIDESSIAVLVPKALDEGSDVEGLGLFLVEAASRGLALVGSATGGIPDVVRDNNNGYLVNPDDDHDLDRRLADLLASPARVHEFGQQARSLVRQEYALATRLARVQLMSEPAPVKEQPCISVIIPVFQTADLLSATLDSLFAQTWKNIEVLIVDDGSTDDVPKAVKPWADRVRVIRQEHRGAPSARNNGATMSHGQYLFFLDADTLLRPDCLEKMYRALATHASAQYAYSDFKFGPKNFHLHDFSDQALRGMNFIHTSSLIRRQAFPGFDPAIKKFQDWDLWLTMLAKGSRGVWWPERLFWVRQRSNGISHWVPKIMYQLPWIGQGWGSGAIRRYRDAERLIRNKHRLP